MVFHTFMFKTSSILDPSVTLRILTGEKHPQIKLQPYEMFEYGHLGHWYIKPTLFKRFFNWNKNFYKNNVVIGKVPCFVIGPFCTHHSICLNIAFWYGNLYGNDAFSILMLSTSIYLFLYIWWITFFKHLYSLICDNGMCRT